MLGKDAISIYLWTHMTHKGGPFTLKDALAYGVIPEADVKTALAELVAAGVLVSKEGDKYEPVDIKMVEVEDYIKSGLDSDGVPVMKSDEKKRNLLATSIQKTFYQGYMPYTFYRLIDKCLYEYHFEGDVVYALFDEGKELKQQYIVAKMYDLAKLWYEKGWTKKEALSEYYKHRDRRTNVANKTAKFLRIHLKETDYERINRWVDVYNADEDIVEFAIRKLEYKGKILTYDVENKLKEWFDAGVMTIDKAMVYENERHEENKAKASRSRGRTNVRRSGKEAGITAAKAEPKKEEKKAEETTPEQPSEQKEEPVHDSILDMFS